MLYLAIDQHAKQLTVNVRNADGDTVLRRQVSTRREKIEAFFQQLTEMDPTFMAILELYKSRAIEMHQDEMYGDILVEARPGVAASDAESSADDAPSPSPTVSPGNADEAQPGPSLPG